MQTIRHCPRCDTDVEDTGGYCLLGHRLTLHAPVASLGELRAEVDQAFEEARLEVAAVVSGASDTDNAEASTRLGPPPPPPARPVPSTEQILAHKASVWKELEKDIDLTNDPIGAFAPPPSMDWGPEKTGVLKRKPSRRRFLKPSEAQ
jgi:hypothetical protein